MTNIPAWAFTKEEQEEKKRRGDRYREIEHLKKDMKLNVTPAYGRTEYKGVVPDRSLSDLDILLLCDSGNTCFGGSVMRLLNGTEFSAVVYTD